MAAVTRPEGAPPVALTIAGSDSGGGAGIQADLKTFHAFGVFGTSAITAVTAQNTLGVQGIETIDPAMVRLQIRAVAEDLQPAAAKTGMLADAAIIEAVASTLAREVSIPHLVVDPVMVAASGDPLLAPGAECALRERLLPLATLVTPNLDEAALLTGRPVVDEADMRAAATAVAETSGGAVLVKGGHLEGPEVVDLLLAGGRWREWRARRLESRSGHGTGCTLSAAIAAGLALGWPLEEAVDRAIHFTREAIASGLPLGGGAGPLDHWTRAPGPTEGRGGASRS
jgi:hydroxymethylpyrimidine/phosphomethylpyrimidine kinase